MKKFFMVYVEGGYTPSVKHPDIRIALREAERLARKEHRPAFILEPVMITEEKTEITFKRFEDVPEPELPF